MSKQAGWICCLSDNVVTKGDFAVYCTKETGSPLLRYKEKKPGWGVRCWIRALAYVSDIDLAHNILVESLSEYCTCPEMDKAAFRVPNQAVVDKAVRAMVRAINGLNKVDQSYSAILCKPSRPPSTKLQSSSIHLQRTTIH